MIRVFTLLRRSPWTMALALSSTLLSTLAIRMPESRLVEALVARIDLVVKGQLWRLFSGPLIHTSPGHLVRGLLMIVLIGLLYEHRLGSRWSLVVLGGLAMPTLLVVWLHPALGSYCGLSGTAHACFVAALACEFCSGGPASAYVVVLTAGLVLKLVIEAITGQPLISVSAGPGVRPIPVAHLGGAITGVLLLAPWLLRSLQQSPSCAGSSGAAGAIV